MTLAPSQKILVGNRRYVATLVREIFTRVSGPIPNLEALINQWILYRDAQYGLGCNPYSSYSGKDCGGDIANASLPAKLMPTRFASPSVCSFVKTP